MTLLQTSQNSWQNKMGKKDVVVKPNRTSRLSVIFFIENGLVRCLICQLCVCLMCIISMNMSAFQF